MVRFHLFVVLLAVNWTVRGQEFDIRQYSIREGLPQSQIFALAEDHYGYLWVGLASGGIAKFDGSEFTTYSTKDGLLSNFIIEIDVDKNNNIWIAHPKGISKFDGQSFKTFTVPDSIHYFRRILSLTLEGDTVHVSSVPTMHGKIVNDSVYSWESSNEARRVVAIKKGPEDALYFFLNNREIYIRKDTIEKTLSLPLQNWVPEIIYNRKSSVVFCNKACAEIDFTSGTSRLVSLEEFKKSVPLYDKDRDEYWIKQQDSLGIEGKNDRYGIFLGSDVNVAIKDQEGNIWLGTDTEGIFKVRKKEMQKVLLTKGLSVSNMLKVGTSLWFGTYGSGLYRYSNGKLKQLFIDKIFQNRNNINGLAVSPEGDIWVATSSGLGVFDTNGKLIRWHASLTHKPDGLFTNVQFDEKGNAWVGSYYSGALIVKRDSIHVLNGSEVPGSKTVLSSAWFPFFKKMAFGYESGYDLADDTSVKSHSLPILRNTAITNISPYRDSLVLMATLGAGVIIHVPQTGEIRSFNSTNGLNSDFAYFAGSDAGGYIWIGTERGITRLSLDANLEITDIRFFETEETNQEAWWFGDRKFFGTTNGLYEFIEDKSFQSLKKFPLHFTSVGVNQNQNIVYDQGFYALPQQLNLLYDNNGIRFSFSQVDKDDFTSVRYSHKLENFDKNWSLPSLQNKAEYSNLPPGKYTFKVRTAGIARKVNDQEIAFDFVIVPPFYMTGWFIFLVGFFTLISAGAIIYWRIRSRLQRLLAMEKMRGEEQARIQKEMAQDFHDEMGNQLARIINFTSQLQIENIKASYQDQLYRKIEDTAKNLYLGTREFIWAMNPENENSNNVFDHIKDFAEKMFTDSNILLRADNKLLYPVSLPFGFTREICLIFKEAITNLYKYSRATEVRFTLSPGEQGFEFVLADNGLGFDLEKTSSGNGLMNMKTRAEKLKADLFIYTEVGWGTNISLRITNLKELKHVSSVQKESSYR